MSSRREFLTSTLAATGAALAPRWAGAAPKAMTVVRESSFIKAFDDYFAKTLLPEYEKLTGIKMSYEAVSVGGMLTRLTTIVETKSGPEMAMTAINWPFLFDAGLVDVTDLATEIGKKLGPWHDNIHDAVVVNKKWKALPWGNIGQLEAYRTDWFKEVGVTKFPDTWEDLRIGGKKIKDEVGNPVGVGLSQELDSNMAMRAVLWSFGGSEQDEKGNVTIYSKQSLDAIKYVKALFKETMTPEVFTWDPSSNNRGILAGKLSFVCNAISVTRTAEKDNPEMSKKIWVSPALKGPARRIAAEHVMDCYVVWDFAENKEGAKQFLVDYIDNFGAAFKASEFYNFPCFPKTVPDLTAQIANDPKADPPDKYKVLGGVLDWATNVGYPGYATAAIDEVFNTFVIPTMFAKAAQDVMSPEDALRAAEKEIKRIFEKWK